VLKTLIFPPYPNIDGPRPSVTYFRNDRSQLLRDLAIEFPGIDPSNGVRCGATVFLVARTIDDKADDALATALLTAKVAGEKAVASLIDAKSAIWHSPRLSRYL
jgi:hypothetical protein